MRQKTLNRAQQTQTPDPPAILGLPIRFTGLVLIVSGLIGLAASFVLAVEKYWLLTNPFYTPSCTLGETVSCGPIMNSWQAEVLGFPNPFIGIATFSVVAATGGALLGGARLASWYWVGLQLGVAMGTVFVGWLMYQSLVNIQALCPYCMLVWAVTFVSMWYVSLESFSRLNSHLTGPIARLVLFLIRRHQVVLLAGLVLIGIVVSVTALSFN